MAARMPIATSWRVARSAGVALRRRAHLGRAIVGVALGGALAGAAFLIVANQAQMRGYTTLRFSHALGIMAGGETQESSGRRGALGVVGDTAGPRGLYVALVSALAIVTLYALVGERRCRGRRWPVGGAMLALATFLLVSLVYGPAVNARVPASEAAAGPFCTGAGHGTPLWVALSSLAFGLVAARVYGLVRTRRWWEDKREGLGERLETVVAPSSLRGGSGEADAAPPH
jgi:hypothetical protein